MGRRKKGRAVSGWVLVDKPVGITSTAVVNKVRWAFDARKAGHAGTLDPAATGLLAVALGEATKTVPFVTDALKCYRFEVALGVATNTDDAEGEVIARSAKRPETDAIEAALAQFRGEIQQVPPQFSAVKVDGVRAYALARDGEDMELAARPLWIDQLSLVSRGAPDRVELEMVCGKGGYVRSLARDLGKALGCLGHVVWLRRLWSGPFDVGDAVTMDDIEKRAKDPLIDDLLLPLEDGLEGLPEVRCDMSAAAKLRNGNPAPVVAASASYGELAWASHDDAAVAVGVYRAGLLHPSRVFVSESA